jgi:hypothetical protein
VAATGSQSVAEAVAILEELQCGGLHEMSVFLRADAYDAPAR